MRASRMMTFASVVATGIAVAAPPGLAQAQQKFPTKPIRLVVPFSPGSQSDVLARTIGPKMSESWGQPVVVDTRTGAGGTIGAAIVAKATPDGHTLLLTTTAFVIGAALHSNLPYDPLKDFAGVTQLGFSTSALVVAPALGVKSVKDLIALAQAKPGQILFSSSGTPRPILNQISKEVARIFDLPDIKERLQGMGFVPAPTTPGEHDRILRAQIEAFSKVATLVGLKTK